MKKNAAIALVVAVLALGLAHYIKDTPWYSLFRFSHALQQHDADTAFQYIDVDAVVDDLVKNVVQDATAKQGSTFNPWEKAGDEDAKGFITMILPSFKDAARNEIRTAIQEPAKSGNKGVFKFFAGSASWRDFKIEKQGKIAIVTKKSDKDFAVKLAQVQDGHWKIVQLVSKDLKTSIPKNNR